jgi:hypothetical protein
MKRAYYRDKKGYIKDSGQKESYRVKQEIT